MMSGPAGVVTTAAMLPRQWGAGSFNGSIGQCDQTPTNRSASAERRVGCGGEKTPENAGPGERSTNVSVSTHTSAQTESMRCCWASARPLRLLGQRSRFQVATGTAVEWWTESWSASDGSKASATGLPQVARILSGDTSESYSALEPPPHSADSRPEEALMGSVLALPCGRDRFGPAVREAEHRACVGLAAVLLVGESRRR